MCRRAVAPPARSGMEISMKTRTKRLISAGLITVLVVAMLQFLPNTLPNRSHAEEEDESTYVEVVRGPIDNIWDLPQYRNDNRQNLSRGTAARPFVVLEIVPYEEYAEFGYLVSGCEPIDIENMEPTLQKEVFNTVSTMGTCDLVDFMGPMVYFKDEAECAENENTSGAGYENTWAMPNGGANNGYVYGYYELVEDGQGAFRYTAPTVSGGDQNDSFESTVSTGNEVEIIAPASIEYVGSGAGNLTWHTINEFNLKHDSYSPVEEHFTLAEYKNLYQDVVFEYDSVKAINESDLRNAGDRIYTKRSIEWENYQPKIPVLIIPQYKYNEYSNRELFLKYSVMPDDVDTYSIVIKTITPSELNANTEWIDYADLISISRSLHAGGNNYIDFWKKYNRLGKTSNNTVYVSNYEGDRDLSWESVLKIYNKVNADEEFAALALDDTIYNTVPGPTKNVTVDVYNWNLEKNKTAPTFNVTNASANNVYKLYSMLFCMDPYFFKKIYLSGDDPLVYDDNGVGKNRLQKGDAAEYWCLESFLLAPDDVDLSQYGNTLEQYWNSDAMWRNYNYATCSTATTKKYWCNDHVYAYNGDSSLAMNYITQVLDTDLDKFEDFADYLEANGHGKTAHTAEAIAYILGNKSNPNDPSYGKDLTLRVLDLEPSVDLENDGLGTPKYYLKPSYITMLLPNFRGEVEITHQTTAEFIGKIEDLNTTYQMIYMGLDYSAYNTRNINGVELPDWNDDNLDGKIYLHTGDRMISTEQTWNNRNRSVKWLRQADGSTNTSTELRFPGNDISLLKKNDLETFLNAGYPIIADAFLYNLNALRIDSSSYVHDFIEQNKNRVGVTLFSTGSNTEDVEKAIRRVLQDAVTFTSWPQPYNGRTATEESPVVTNPNYLQNSRLEFGFTVTPIDNKDHYRYKLYLDQDKDSKFADNEVVYDSVANDGFNSLNWRISSAWVGLVQWKLEVYQVTNVNDPNTATGIRYSKVGRSAVQNTGEKKEINVLQIMPNGGGNLNLATDPRFTKYYTELQDYVITVTAMEWQDFEKFFYTENADGTKTTKGFYYDYTKPIGNDLANPNPGNLDRLDEALENYNMFIMGFGDTYGGTNLSNEFGAVDYIRYFVDQGNSILFTHDLSSMLNVGSNDYGYTVNALMRDLMGMNRYKSVSAQANNAGNPSNPTSESDMLKTYQEANASKYDWINSSAIQGYTYYTLKRLGFNGYDPAGLGCKFPYKYMIKNTNGQDYTDQLRFGLGTGFNNTNDETTIVSMANEGQVTMYPYYIGESLKVANTHAQWYCLSPEDPNVTVWYCLAGDPQNIMISDGNKGMSTTYAVSPNDAMNNYYIYSKGNIFYSGVGHTAIDGEMETKLFINTMVAASDTIMVPPTIEVTNEESFLRGYLRYAIELLQTYDFGFDAAGNFQQTVEVFDSSDLYPVNFTPIDSNLISTSFESKIYFDIGESSVVYVDTVVELTGENGTPVMVNGRPKELHADSNHVFTNMENGKFYRIYFPMNYMSKEIHDTYFWIKNDRGKESTTKLEVDVQPLFPLD